MEINDKTLQTVFMVIIVLLGIFFTISAFNTEMLGEDEALYRFLGEEFSKPEPIKYFSYNFESEMPLIQPFFMTLVFSSLFMVFGSSLALAKVVVAVLGILTVLLVYMTGKKFNIWYGIASAFLLLTITSFSHFSMLAYLEVPIAFFSALITYAVISFSDSFKNWSGLSHKAVILGIFLAMAYFTKFSGLIMVVIVFLYLLFLYSKSKNKNYLKNLLLILIVFSVLIAPYVIKNIILFNYPYFEPLNTMFSYDNPRPQWMVDAMSSISPVSLSIANIMTSFGWIPAILAIFGASYLFYNKDGNKKENLLLIFSIIMVFVFILSFSVIHITGYTILEYRHFSVIYPQIALLGGLFLWKLKDFRKTLTIFLIVVVVLGLYTSASVVSSTSNQVRYPAAYIEGLNWIKYNTPEDSVLFTVYMGSVMEYANRKVVWTTHDFPELMSTQDNEFIYNKLKEYGVSHIFIWRQVVAQNYVIPHANLIGVFTYNFIERVNNDNRYNLVFSNSEVSVYEVL